MKHRRAFDPFPAVVLAAAILSGSANGATAGFETQVVERSNGAPTYSAEGAVEPVRASILAPQVVGRVTTLNVRAGDTVRAGQVLATIDERAARQQVAASQAQAAAADAQLEAARREFERQQRLFRKQYLSQAALDRAEMQFKAASAEARAMLAQSGVVQTQSGFHTLVAPYAGVVSAVNVELGDMAMPGKPAIELYDPATLRVAAHVPEAVAQRIERGRPAAVELPTASAEQRRFEVSHFTVLPRTDPLTHTVELRMPLPESAGGLVPGLFARVRVPLAGDKAEGALTVPGSAVIRRSELDAVYVLAADGRPLLRQVRLGRRQGGRVEVLAGLAEGEAVVLDPLSAARR